MNKEYDEWILNSLGETIDFTDENLNSKSCTHVIEYAAYKELEEQNKIMREALEAIKDSYQGGADWYELAKDAIEKCNPMRVKDD